MTKLLQTYWKTTGNAGQVSQSDPWRLTVNTGNLGLNGFQAEALLQNKYGIYPELATHQVGLSL